MKLIRLSGHALQNLQFRGVTEAEIIETIQSKEWTQAGGGWLECRKNFPFGKDWNGKIYTTKQVRPIFVDEEKEIVVVTVYAYYF
ncbi:MAG TPA: DUF4258 domain-containing protein [Candidatus Tripitaka californicus]|uniref:DUF4258 domain-containing protein n=1 Tax=Candidatus Tripitaka californicus TaxID=3367616 RepID=UPI004028406C|nr:DUF4258 domain-containing protein [Planctomycetota bacterium]